MRVIGRILFLFNVTTVMRILDRTAWQNNIAKLVEKKALQKKGTGRRWGGTGGGDVHNPLSPLGTGGYE